MLFWFVAALLTLGACLAVMSPFLRAPGTNVPEDANDITVYRDQLAEVDRDLERGVIGNPEAEQARAEIGRRILAAKSVSDTRTEAGGGRRARAIAAAAVLLVPIASWGIYAFVGSPYYPAQPLQARLSKDPANSSLDELVARAEAHLADNPSDGRGWSVLAPIYQRLGRHTSAITAYRNAIRLAGATADREAGLGEAIAAEGGGIISAEAQAALERALALDPGNPKARFLLATGYMQEGDAARAIETWQAMSDALPDDSPWSAAARESIQRTEARLAASQDDERGPSTEQVEAAADMSEAERTAMIEGMVATLDERLRENPGDPDGWARLVRSYLVLGDERNARDALSRGVSALGEESGEAARLRRFAEGLGIKETNAE